MRIATATATAIALLPAAGPAQEVSGTISGTLDLDDVSWTVRTVEDVPTSGWHETGNGTQVEIHGYPEANPASTEESISIAFTLPDGAARPVAEDPVVTYHQGNGPTLTAMGENLDLGVTNVTVQGDRLTVSGGVNALLTYGQADELIVDPGADATTFDGNFQATLTRTE